MPPIACIKLTDEQPPDKRQGPSGPNGTNSNSSTPTNLSSSQNGHLKNGQHLNCSMNNGMLDQANSDCLDEHDLSTNGLLLDDEDSLDETTTKSSLIMNSNMNAGQSHLQLDNSLELAACQQNQLAGQAGGLPMGSNHLNTSLQSNHANELNASSCALTQNSIMNSQIKIEPFNSSQSHSSQIAPIHNASKICTSQNYPTIFQQVESGYPPLEDRKVDSQLVNCRQSDCVAPDCRPSLMQCSRQSSIESYSSDSFNLLHSALSTSSEPANSKCSTSLNAATMNGGPHLANSHPATGAKRGRAKRNSTNWSNNQKLNNSSNQMHSSYIKNDANCSPPSMIPTPPMENKLNCSGNQLHPNLVQSPLLNDLPATEFYPQQQQRGSILGATLQNRPPAANGPPPAAGTGYASMEMINNHRRAYPSPSSSTSSSYMSPTSQTLNHSPNSNSFASTAGTSGELSGNNKFSSNAMLQHPSTGLPHQANAYQPPRAVDQNNVFLYNNAPIAPATTQPENDNQTSFNCENNAPAASKPYSNQCLSTNSNIYNVNIEQPPQQAYAASSQSNEQSFQQPYSAGGMYLPSGQQFVQQSNPTYQPANGYGNFNNSNSYQQPPNGQQFNFADSQPYGSSKGDLFYGTADSNYHTSSGDLAYSNGQMLNDGFSAGNDYYSDGVYGNCQPFGTENYGVQDYQQLS